MSKYGLEYHMLYGHGFNEYTTAKIALSACSIDYMDRWHMEEHYNWAESVVETYLQDTIVNYYHTHPGLTEEGEDDTAYTNLVWFPN